MPPDEFTAARDALAKQRRADGDKEGAAAVKALRKPTAAAWAVNQLSRKHRKPLDELLELGEQLRKAQTAALSGRGAAKLRDLSAQRRKDVDALAKKAVKLLESDAQRDAITNTLEAALASASAADAVRAGRLAKELPAPSGFGEDGDAGGDGDRGDAGDNDIVSLDEARAARDRRRAARAAKRGGTEAATETATASAEFDRLVDDKRAALESAAEEAQAAAREAAAARAEVSRLQDALVTANGRAKAAAERARVAQWTQSQAQQDLDAAERSRDDARS